MQTIKKIGRKELEILSNFPKIAKMLTFSKLKSSTKLATLKMKSNNLLLSWSMKRKFKNRTRRTSDMAKSPQSAKNLTF